MLLPSNAPDSRDEHDYHQEWQPGIGDPFRVMGTVNQTQRSLWKKRWAANKDTVQLYDQNKSKVDNQEVEKGCVNKNSRYFA